MTVMKSRRAGNAAQTTVVHPHTAATNLDAQFHVVPLDRSATNNSYVHPHPSTRTPASQNKVDFEQAVASQYIVFSSLHFTS
jgi:hypothetical protein